MTHDFYHYQKPSCMHLQNFSSFEIQLLRLSLLQGWLESLRPLAADRAQVNYARVGDIFFTLFKMDIKHDFTLRIFVPFRMILIIMEVPKMKERVDSNKGNKRNHHFL